MTLTTRWGRELDRSAPLPEYPRPQLVRDSYLNLNGEWDYAITAESLTRPPLWDGTILVPFSPETPLSGVGRMLLPSEALWYRRTVGLPDGFRRHRVIVHFGAVDQRCDVFVNEVLVGSHRGGYLPFSIDITDAVEGSEFEIVVRVTDLTDTASESRGKQVSAPGGIWYTPQSGIWQTVWLESVPEQHVTDLRIDTDVVSGSVTLTVGGAPGHGEARILAAGTEVARVRVTTGEPTRVSLPDARLWSPADPFLYDLEVTLGDDEVTSYFGVRAITRESDSAGVQRLLLNGEPLLHAGLLDQGYWPDGLYTAPSDEALRWDIEFALSAGFTMVRKHIKIEPARWYYHCDRLGMLVWQDMVNGGQRYSPVVITTPVALPLRLSDRHYGWFARGDQDDRVQFLTELEETIAHLRPFPSIVTWVPFNEGWGQFDALDVERRTRELDPTRLVDHASGWHDQGGGDFRSLHVYFRRFRVRRRWRRDGRALALTEFGGYSLPVTGHRSTSREFGYRRYRTGADFWRALRRLWIEELEPAVAGPLVAFVYTQLSDVEDEVNGLVTYDREVVKIPVEDLRDLNHRLIRLHNAATEGTPV
ncbi:MAG: glycoside hydrolase family 2 TIM barrel-domain containing protein [Rhodoglobus sp.]|nr:glycoside hydrolase family 2 TIM barrel-domain containing protein [Rhodoglobus sp.]